MATVKKQGEWRKDYNKELKNKAMQIRENIVCETCLDIAEENGLTDRISQEQAMIDIGSMVQDHICESLESEERCDCDCLSGQI